MLSVNGSWSCAVLRLFLIFSVSGKSIRIIRPFHRTKSMYDDFCVLRLLSSMFVILTSPLVHFRFVVTVKSCVTSCICNYCRIMDTLRRIRFSFSFFSDSLGVVSRRVWCAWVIWSSHKFWLLSFWFSIFVVVLFLFLSPDFVRE